MHIDYLNVKIVDWVMSPRVSVIIPAKEEWKAIEKIYPNIEYQESPYGEWFKKSINDTIVLFFLGGVGKISSAASTQYVIDRWNPELIINLGTCGGFKGEILRDTLILVEKAVIYDIWESPLTDMIIEKYSTEIDLSWLNNEFPIPVQKVTIVSGDTNIRPQDIPFLKTEYGASVGDWESGSIAWVCNKNDVKLLILRGVSDLVGPTGGEAYEDEDFWIIAADRIMIRLLNLLPDVIQNTTNNI
jgi:adenosylhomocysteine nucleosidase